MKNKDLFGVLAVGVLLTINACQKISRPTLGEYPIDDVKLPAGDLRFFVPFDSLGISIGQNMKDSISGIPSYWNELKLAAGVNGSKALKGKDGAAVKYLNANDMKNATSFTVAFWVKREVNNRTEFYFGLTANSKDYWHQSAMFFMAEHATPTAATVKFAVDDKWFEFNDKSFKRPLFDGKWHHIVISYSETASTMSWYFDGALMTDVPAQAVKHNAQSGPIKIKSAGNIVLGGWNKHAGLNGVGDDWVKSFEGEMDQFRMYNKALSATEVQALYNSKL